MLFFEHFKEDKQCHCIIFVTALHILKGNYHVAFFYPSVQDNYCALILPHSLDVVEWYKQK